jgi:hypothetical protein
MKLLRLALLISCTALGADLASTRGVLNLAGKSLQDFWEQISNVDCVENVQQFKLGPNGQVLYRLDSSFDYLVTLQLAGSDILVGESRVPIGKPDDRKNVPLLLTNGFSTLSFIFHPIFQHAFVYAPPTPAEVDGRRLLAVQFRHVPGARSPSLLKLKNRDYPVDWQGTAWIDPASGAIVHISASLMPGLEDLGLKTLSADVRFSPVKFKDQPEAWWLPETATIEVETARQHWRNIHSFGRYRVFQVDVNTKTEIPK